MRADVPILGLEFGVLRVSRGVDEVEISPGRCPLGSVVLLEFVVTDGRPEFRSAERGLLLKSVCDRAAGLDCGSATGIGSVELRLPLVVRLLRLPSSPECTSRWLA
jgi:hypothetical protein